jgi:hypothetical protein
LQNVRSTNVQEAVDDLGRRTLSCIPSKIGKLICLGSTRDYNTGIYHHDGLAFRFSREAAEEALQILHLRNFEELALLPLESLVRECEEFLRSACVDAPSTIQAWKRLQPFRVLIPLECDLLLGELLFSNIRVALSILEDRQKRNPPQRLCA